MATIADLERQFYLANVTAPDASTSISDLERRYYIQVLGLTEPAVLDRSNSDLKQDRLD
jgi:hypothetical protein